MRSIDVVIVGLVLAGLVLPAGAEARRAGPQAAVAPASQPSSAPADGVGAGPGAAPRGAVQESAAPEVFLFLEPIAVGESSGDLAGVLARLAASTLTGLEAVRLKSHEEMPDVPGVVARYGDLLRLDRVSLINLRNVTGFDGLVRFAYRYENGHVDLTAIYFDFRNGEVFRHRRLTQAVDARLFAVIQDDLVEFATRIRRGYRVTLKITSQPDGAQVTVNRRVLGRTPLVRELKAGTYTIRVSHEGYRPYEQQYRLGNGETLVLNAVLYNPLAARFLNAKPGLRLDSRQLTLGYRYAYLGLDRPALRHAHFFTAEGALRIGALDFGLRFASAQPTVANPLDTFVGAEEGQQVYDHLLLQVQAIAKYPLWEKYSFAAVRLCTAQGLTYASTSSGGGSISAWSYAADAYVELSSRLFRAGNFATEVQVNAGVTYLGRLPYTEKTFSLFGDGPEETKRRHLIGAMGGLALRMVFYNDIF